MNVELLNHKDCRLVLLVSEKDIHDPSICPIMLQVLFDHITCFFTIYKRKKLFFNGDWKISWLNCSIPLLKKRIVAFL